MPNFKKNTSSAMKRSGFKMKGWSPFDKKDTIREEKFEIDEEMDKKDTVVIDGKTYPAGYTKKDVKFLEEQREDIVRYEDLDEKGKEIFRKKGEKFTKKN